MQLPFVYGLITWSTGLYWSLVRYVFPINNEISKIERGLILFNQLIHSTLLIYSRNLFSDHILPINFKNMIFQLAIFILGEEVFFYYSHRLLHKKWFYQKIHYIHHKWKNTYSDIALYSHPIEHLINVTGPMILPILFRTDYLTIMIWISIILVNTTYVHSEIDLNDLHNIHHKIPIKNYGVLGLLDKFHGTLLRKIE